MASSPGRWVAGRGLWASLLLSAVLGLCAAAALPPFYALPLILPAFTGLVWLLDGAGARWRGFAVSWVFAFTFFTGGLYWVAEAFYVEAERFGALAPFAVAGLSALLALFHAGTLWIARRWFWRGAGRVVALATAWLLAEALRGVVFTGFPWNLIGSVWAFSDSLLQPAALLGIWGLSLLTVLLAALPACLAGGRRAAVLAGAVLTLCLGAAGYGALRLDAAPPPETDQVEGVLLRLVQPNIRQADKWRDDLRLQHVARQLEMSLQSGGDQRPSHVIWSETAVPYLLNRSPGLIDRLGGGAPEGGLLITGAPRGVPEEQRYWNSLFAIDPSGTVRATYDKAHLVPFGEYVPFEELIGWTKLTAGRADFSSGPGLASLTLAGLPPASPLICYEIIFPAKVVPGDGPRPQWLLNLTNDNWFGHSSGPHQHLVAARLRAVEEGLPVIRAANGGISAAIDAHGRVRASLGLGRSGVLDVPLPRPSASRTLFSRLQEASLLVLAGFAAALFFATRDRL